MTPAEGKRAHAIAQLATHVLHAICRQHNKQLQTLADAGYRSIARVQARLIREQLHAREDDFYLALDQLEQRGLVLREHGLVRPL